MVNDDDNDDDDDDDAHWRTKLCDFIPSLQHVVCSAWAQCLLSALTTVSTCDYGMCPQPQPQPQSSAFAGDKQNTRSACVSWSRDDWADERERCSHTASLRAKICQYSNSSKIRSFCQRLWRRTFKQVFSFLWSSDWLQFCFFFFLFSIFPFFLYFNFDSTSP